MDAYKKITRVRPGIGVLGRDQGARNSYPQAWGRMFRELNLAPNTDIGRIGHLWMDARLRFHRTLTAGRHKKIRPVRHAITAIYRASHVK